MSTPQLTPSVQAPPPLPSPVQAPPPTQRPREIQDGVDLGEAQGAVEAGVIKEARRRQRRRWVALSVVVVLLGALAGLVSFGGGRDQAARSGGAHARQVGAAPVALDPGALFSQSPYMGVACGIPNSIGCDRIGLTVWLRRPARSVIASVGGRSFALSDPTWSGPSHRGLRTRFAGFLQPAGIIWRLGVSTQRGTHWDGSYGPSPLVMLQIDRGHGRPLVAWVNVFLAAGWG